MARFRFLFLLALGMSFAFLSADLAWAQRGLKDIPDPDAASELASFLVAEGFEVNLFASDPQIAKPIQMNFDERGRLWIASSEVYPHIKPGQKADDKILVLEDKDQDGVADETTVFARGLLIPTGVVPGDGGAYVVNSTELLHLRDSKGDGKADQQRIVLSGFGTEDTHHLLHTLRWGPDGALYMNQSIYIHSHVETPSGVRRLNGGGIWRFRPEAMQLEILCRGFVNPWGHHFDRWGQSFATDGAYGEGINYVFPESVFVAAPGASRRLEGLNPGSPKHCGLEILSGRHLPESWRGNMITNDFRAHRVCRFVVTEDGAGYASRQETELIKSTHVAFRPIDVKMGPDGAIYIADWYNPIIQHGEVDFRDSRRDHVHGRIWRVTAKGRPPAPRVDVHAASVPELLEFLKRPEQWVRLHAKLELKQRGAAEVKPHLPTWLDSLDPADLDSEHARLEALWVHQALYLPNLELLDQLLASQDHRVRAAAVRVLSHWLPYEQDPYRRLERAVHDEHPRVRLEAVSALARLPSSTSAEMALQVLNHPMDRFLDFALWQAMRTLQPQWLAALKRGEFSLGGNVEHLTFALRAVDSPDVVQPLLELVKNNRIPQQRVPNVLALIASLGSAEELEAMLDMVLDSDSGFDAAGRAALLDSLVEATTSRKVRPSGDLARVLPLLEGEALPLRQATVSAVGAWKLKRAANTLLGWIPDEQVPEPLKREAIGALGRLATTDSLGALERLAQDNAVAGSLREAALQALAEQDLARATPLVVHWLQNLPNNQDPQPLLTELLTIKNAGGKLAEHLRKASLPSDVAKLALRAARRSGQASDELVAALQQAGQLENAAWRLTPELLTTLVADVHDHGDAARGEAIYRRKELQCMKCHAIAGAGGLVGPDLVSLGASAQVDYLVDSLLAPDNKVKENFHSVMVQTDEGKVLAGIPIRTTDRELVLRDAEDREVSIPQDAIVAQKEGRSLMPDGTVDELTREELVDLIRFLSQLGKVGDFAVGQQRMVRRWQVLLPTKESTHRLRRSSYDTAATDDPVFDWESVYSRVSGELPIEDLPGFIAPTFVTKTPNDLTVFVRFEIDVSTEGPLVLHLGETTGLTGWVDGKPTPLSPKTRLDLSAGLHRVTLAVNKEQRDQPLQVELQDVAGAPTQAQFVGGK